MQLQRHTENAPLTLSSLPACAAQHRVKLSTFIHANDAVTQEGSNKRVAACDVMCRAAVLTTESHVHFYRVTPARADALLPAALLQLADGLKPAELRLYQSLDLRPYGKALAVAAGAFRAGPARCQATPRLPTNLALACLFLIPALSLGPAA
jgi:hypothetical protein